MVGGKESNEGKKCRVALCSFANGELISHDVACDRSALWVFVGAQRFRAGDELQ